MTLTRLVASVFVATTLSAMARAQPAPNNNGACRVIVWPREQSMAANRRRRNSTAATAALDALGQSGGVALGRVESIGSAYGSMPCGALNGLDARGIDYELDQERQMFDPTPDDDNATASRKRQSGGGETRPYGIDMVWQGGAATFGDAPVTVCITDTGYARHVDLPCAGATPVSSDELCASVTCTPMPNTGSCFSDAVGHGTIGALSDNGLGVAGVIGESPPLRLHVVKLFDDAGAFRVHWLSDLLAAYDSCVEAGARVLSQSIGCDAGVDCYSSSEDSWYTLNADVILAVAAAGNDGNDAHSYPASYATVMSVAAVDESMTHVSFSQHNDQVDIAAPGYRVLSTYGTDDYVFWSGTSMATPHVAGAAAALFTHCPRATPAHVRAALEETALDRGVAGRDDFYGHGVVRIPLALERLRTIAPGDCDDLLDSTATAPTTTTTTTTAPATTTTAPTTTTVPATTTTTTAPATTTTTTTTAPATTTIAPATTTVPATTTTTAPATTTTTTAPATTTTAPATTTVPATTTTTVPATTSVASETTTVEIQPTSSTLQSTIGSSNVNEQSDASGEESEESVASESSGGQPKISSSCGIIATRQTCIRARGCRWNMRQRACVATLPLRAQTVAALVSQAHLHFGDDQDDDYIELPSVDTVPSTNDNESTSHDDLSAGSIVLLIVIPISALVLALFLCFILMAGRKNRFV